MRFKVIIKFKQWNAVPLEGAFKTKREAEKYINDVKDDTVEISYISDTVFGHLFTYL